MYLRQAFALALFAFISEWHPSSLFKWLRQTKKTLKAGAGLRSIGCFGVNPHIVWEVTRRCNLRCKHCHAFGGEPLKSKEISTEDARMLIKKLSESGIKTFVFSGGEPLMRKDIFTLISDARNCGLNTFIATNGTLITREIARKLSEYDVGVVVGIDAMSEEIHDDIRGVKGALKATMRGIENCLRYDAYLHFNILASKRNLREVERVIDFGNEIGVFSYFIYNFVPAGRGAEISEYALSDEEFNELLRILAEKQREACGIIIPVAAPEYFAFLLMRKGIKSEGVVKFIGRFISGCLMARCGMLYIKPDGDTWKCPFMPESRIGNILSIDVRSLNRSLNCSPNRSLTPLSASRRFHNASQRFHNTECESCPYRHICGGCAARGKCGLLRKP